MRVGRQLFANEILPRTDREEALICKSWPDKQVRAGKLTRLDPDL